MQASVLDGHGQLARQREEQALLALPIGPRARLVDGERADHLVVDDQWNDERPANSVRLPAFLEPVKARVAPHVLDEEIATAAKRAERELEEPLRQVGMRSFQASG